MASNVDSVGEASASGSVDCDEVHANASDFIDDDCTPSLTHRIKAHLGLCRDCDGWVRTLATTVGIARDLPQEEVPDSLKQKIRDISESS